MAALIDQIFANTFDFSRPIVAASTDAQGQSVDAPVDAPRFDHDETGQRRGLLIEAGPFLGQHDKVTVKSGDWEIKGPATILMEYEAGGAIIRRAVYSRNARATINACLNIQSHFRTIGAVAGHLPNIGARTGEIFTGFVKYRNRDWQLGRPLTTGDGKLLSDGDGRVMIEST